MPRSLAELSLALPACAPHPAPGRARRIPRKPLVAQPSVARTLLSEYLKFLPAAAQLTVARLLGPRRAELARGDAGRTPGRDLRPTVSVLLTVLRSLLFVPVFYINTALFVVLGSFLLFGPRRYAMMGLRTHAIVSLWLLKVDRGHAHGGARARQAPQAPLSRRLQAPVGVGHLRAHPHLLRPGHGHEGGAGAHSLLRLVLAQVRARVRRARARAGRAAQARARCARARAAAGREI